MTKKILIVIPLAVLLVGLLLYLAVLSGILGVNLPKLTGSYSVGRVNYDLEDTSRHETFVNDPNKWREIVVTIYYPADPPAHAKPAPYVEGEMAKLLTAQVHLPAAAANLIHSHAYENVSVSSGTFPVVLFFPGIGTPPLEYTSTVEDLASHGYVVAMVYPTFSVPVTIFSDGSVALINQAGFRSENEPAGTDAAQTTRDRDAIGSVWVADARFTLDQLTILNRNDPLLRDHLNLEQVGIYGHSFGGATAAEVLRIDSRFKAGINMDGTAFSMTSPNQISQPFMWMASDYSQVTDSQLKQIGMSRTDFEAELQPRQAQREIFFFSLNQGYLFTLKGSTHNSYITDEALISAVVPGLKDNLAAINGSRAVSVINAYVSAFFDRALKKQNNGLLNANSSAFPEAELRAKNR